MLLALGLAAAPSVQLAARVDAGPARPGWAFARRGQKVTLHAELSGGKARTVRWSKLVPTADSVDNTQPSFHFEPIPYRAQPIAACDDQLDCPADVGGGLRVAPGLEGTGNMAFQVEATLDSGAAVQSPGLEARDVGGLSPKVMRVVVRRDDSYLGYLTELNGSPFIFGSAGPDGRNQTDRLLGADCADLAVYGRRRLGLGAKYTSTYHFDEQAPELTRAVALDDGHAADAKGRAIAFGEKGVRVGDVLHFPGSRHVAVLWEDRPPLGVLDPGDLMFHTCWGPPTVEPIGEASCASLPWRVLRWPQGR